MSRLIEDREQELELILNGIEKLEHVRKLRLQLMRHLFQPFHRLLDNLVVECWLGVREVPGSFPSQGSRHTKDVIKWYQQFPCLTLNIKKGNTGYFSRIKKINVMDNIWDRSRRSLAVVAGMKKTNDHAEATKVERLQKTHFTLGIIIMKHMQFLTKCRTLGYAIRITS